MFAVIPKNNWFNFYENCHKIPIELTLNSRYAKIESLLVKKLHTNLHQKRCPIQKTFSFYYNIILLISYSIEYCIYKNNIINRMISLIDRIGSTCCYAYMPFCFTLSMSTNNFLKHNFPTCFISHEITFAYSTNFDKKTNE